MEFVNRSQAVKETGLSYLGTVNSSQKILKNKKVSKVITYIIYLAPAKTSGYNVCSHSTPECRLGCLDTSGRNKMEIACGRNWINKARIKKSKLFFEEQSFFMGWMIAEIKAQRDLAIAQGYGFSARLNGTSDINWSNVFYEGQNIFEIFPEIQFYDYTKNSVKLSDKVSNYHLTLSYTGRNWVECENALNSGINVAIVFDTKKNKPLPAMYMGFKVIDGDLTDYRVNDGQGVIVGLRFKSIANKENEAKVKNSIFVIREKELVVV